LHLLNFFLVTILQIRITKGSTLAAKIELKTLQYLSR
jgi:hypothetical protein